MSERFMHRSGGHSTALLQPALVIPLLPNSVHRFRTRVATVPVSVPLSVPSKICKKFPVLRF